MDSKKNDVYCFYTTIALLFCSYLCLILHFAFSSSNIIFKILDIYIIISNILTFYRCSLLDPGFIYENKHPTFDLQPLHFKNTVDLIPDALNNTRKIQFTEFDGRTKIYVQKYCTTCNIFRPFKAAHCNDCGRCILEKDHHCVWVSNCIGRNNSKIFFCFITTLSIICIRSAVILKRFYDLKYKEFYSIIIKLLYFNHIVLSTLIVAFTLYNTFLGLIDVKSRVFINSYGSINYRIDSKKVLKRLLTLRPAIISDKIQV